MLVADRDYDVVDASLGAQALLQARLEGVAPGRMPNLLRLTFELSVRQRLVNFDEVGQALLWRVQREVLADPSHERLRVLLDEVLQQPGVATKWRTVDFKVPASPVLPVHLRVGGAELKFLTAVTVFQAPQSVQLEELRIETWYPIDGATDAYCRAVLRDRR